MCWYLRMSVNRRNDLQIFDFFRLLTIFFCDFYGDCRGGERFIYVEGVTNIHTESYIYLFS